MATLQDLRYVLGKILVQGGVPLEEGDVDAGHTPTPPPVARPLSAGTRRIVMVDGKLVARGASRDMKEASKKEVEDPEKSLPRRAPSMSANKLQPRGRGKAGKEPTEVIVLRKRSAGPLMIVSRCKIEKVSRTPTPRQPRPPQYLSPALLPLSSATSLIDETGSRYTFHPTENTWAARPVSCSVDASATERSIVQRATYSYFEGCSNKQFLASSLFMEDPRLAGWDYRGMSIQAKRIPLPKEAYYIDVAGYTVAAGFARIWNKTILRDPVTFTEAHLLKVDPKGKASCYYRLDTPNPYRQGQLYGVLERDMSYSLWNGDSKRVNTSLRSANLQERMHAFTHFTFSRSCQTLIVIVSKFCSACPLEVTIALTDTALSAPEHGSWASKHHRKSLFKGRETIGRFFAMHQCSALCRSLGLSASPYYAPTVVRVASKGPPKM
eukprot:TRINITY_DN25037_c0_g1_i1.p1 TRINITY_DN25037_c0_g1~~TRINITY_DN25037_c0_g1_i1.p1  ORF type:complete len:438 (+),score=45.37 TRINITY_DN25037_c0_g1_i1:40-1353(+)